MNKFYLHLSLIAIAISFMGYSLIAQDSYKIEYKFQKGKTYRFNHISNSNITQEMMGKEMKITNASDMTIRVAVDDITKEGNFGLVVSVDSAKNTTKSPMKDTTMILSNLIGKRTKITVSKIGAVLSREIIDTIKNEGIMGGGSQRGMAQITRLPEKEVKIGEKWNSTTIDTIESMGGKIYHTSNFEYTLSGKEKKQNRDCLKIDYTGTTSDTGKMMMNGMELFVEGGGKVKGILYFDPKAGMTVVEESTTDNEQTMAITGQQNMTIPMSVTSKSVKTLLEK
ncbi:MAG: hypothetical protein HZB59_13780 [Ignavibacteriales bacterium]|nr:hypothetical protein [Ignavibacteriales bacterium]